MPDDADPALVARAVVAIVAAPIGKRPFRTIVDPSHDGAEMLHRTGLSELLTPDICESRGVGKAPLSAADLPGHCGNRVRTLGPRSCST